jgi:hypothetical protein
VKNALLLVTCLALLAGCETRTEYGKCVGLGEGKDPKLTYKLSTTNVIVGVVFAELIIPPIIVVADETFCPVGNAEPLK